MTTNINPTTNGQNESVATGISCVHSSMLRRECGCQAWILYLQDCLTPASRPKRCTHLQIPNAKPWLLHMQNLGSSTFGSLDCHISIALSLPMLMRLALPTMCEVATIGGVLALPQHTDRHWSEHPMLTRTRQKHA